MKQIRLQKLLEQCAVRIQTQYRRYRRMHTYKHTLYWHRLKQHHILHRVVLIQKSFRGWIQRNSYRTLVIHRNLLQIRWEWWKFLYGRMRGRKNKAVLLLQRIIRGHLVRLKKLLQKSEQKPEMIRRVCELTIEVRDEGGRGGMVYIPLPPGGLERGEVVGWLERVGVVRGGVE
ncbi:hypothetical protein EON65_43985, partial [archaeon]